MIAGFHGNSDPLVVAFLIWAVYCAEKHSPVWVTGILFAAACSIKVWPLFLVPAFCLSFASWRQRILFPATVLAAWFVFGVPSTFEAPALIARNVFGYRSLGGWWGLSGSVAGYGRFGTAIAFAAVLLATVYLHRLGTRLYGVVGGAIAVFLVFTPGFGVQYLAWILPFCFLLGWRAVAGISFASSVLLLLAYTHWSGGFPWYFADSLRPGVNPYSWEILYAATICWIMLVLAVVSITPIGQWIAGGRIAVPGPGGRHDRTGPAFGQK